MELHINSNIEIAYNTFSSKKVELSRSLLGGDPQRFNSHTYMCMYIPDIFQNNLWEKHEESRMNIGDL